MRTWLSSKERNSLRKLKIEDFSPHRINTERRGKQVQYQHSIFNVRSCSIQFTYSYFSKTIPQYSKRYLLQCMPSINRSHSSKHSTSISAILTGNTFNSYRKNPISFHFLWTLELRRTSHFSKLYDIITIDTWRNKIIFRMRITIT